MRKDAVHNSSDNMIVELLVYGEKEGLFFLLNCQAGVRKIVNNVITMQLSL